MKINYIIDYLYSINGGTERQLYRLIKGMINSGHSVNLYVLRQTDYTKNVDDFPCPITYLNVKSMFSIKSWLNLWRFRRKTIHEKSNIIHGFFNDTAIIIPILFFGAKIKRYTSRRDMGIWYSPFKLLLLRVFSLSSTRLICNSHEVAKLAEKKEWKSQKKITVIYNGIDHFPIPENINNPSWLDTHALKDNVYRIVLIANVRPVKCIETLIEAAKITRQHNLNVKYYIIGHLSDDIYYQQLCSLIDKHHLSDDFIFTGSLLEPRLYLNNFDIGILTSSSEGLSNSIMDYLDAGLPVIATNVGGNPELVIHESNGFLFTKGDNNKLASYVMKLLEDEDLRRQFSENSRQLIENFDTTSMIERHELEYSH